MRPDAALLVDIVIAGRRVREFLGEIDREAFLHDLKTQSAVLHQLLIVGEAVSRLSDDTRSQHPEIPWRTIRAMRNILIHVYETVDPDQVWSTATEDVPFLLERLAPYVDDPEADPGDEV